MRTNESPPALDTVSYMKRKDIYSTVMSHLRLIFSISQSEEAQGIHDFFSHRNLPIVESYHDLNASFEMLKKDLYKQAFVSLRMGRDNGVLAAHWRAVGYRTSDFKKWLSSEIRTPWRKTELWNPIRTLNGVARFFERFSIDEAIDSLDRLNDYVHTRGLRYSTTGVSERSIRARSTFVYCDEWYDLFLATSRIVVTLQMLVNPKLAIVIPIGYLLRKFGTHDHIPFCGVMFGDYSESIKSCVGESEYEALVEKAESSPECKEVREYLDSVPDLSENEIRGRSIVYWKSLEFDESTVRRYVAETMRLVRRT